MSAEQSAWRLVVEHRGILPVRIVESPSHGGTRYRAAVHTIPASMRGRGLPKEPEHQWLDGSESPTRLAAVGSLVSRLADDGLLAYEMLPPGVATAGEQVLRERDRVNEILRVFQSEADSALPAKWSERLEEIATIAKAKIEVSHG